ncbi:hypothetical protein NMG60_11030957 [Bertholletia excelsa]
MTGLNGKSKKGLISKTWERCRSLGGTGGGGIREALIKKSKSWPRLGGGADDENIPPYERIQQKLAGKCRVTPKGCFSVCVGPQKQRFVIKTEYLNHPLFKMLLEEAELEYGFSSEGPLALPCNVDFFCRVLVEIEYTGKSRRPGCGSGCFSSPSRLVAMNNF